MNAITAASISPMTPSMAATKAAPELVPVNGSRTRMIARTAATTNPSN